MPNTWVNPYQVTQQGRDALALVGDGRVEMKRMTGYGKDWRPLHGAGTWYPTTSQYLDLYYQAGMIATVGPLATNGAWGRTCLTQAGMHLYEAWLSHPFTVIEREKMDVDTAIARIKETYGDALDELGRR